MFLSLIEYFGGAAFASSGAMQAIKKDMDLLGVIVMGVMTACGGGLIRDILLGIVPAGLFLNPSYMLIVVCVSLAIFLFMRKTGGEGHFSRTMELVVSVADTIGLSMFTIAGISKGIQMGYGDYAFFLAFLGVITGVGGGILRDICCNQIPAVFTKRIYACASISGACLYVLSYKKIGLDAAMVISIATIFLIRYFAVKYGWSLPKAVRRKETQE